MPFRSALSASIRAHIRRMVSSCRVSQYAVHADTLPCASAKASAATRAPFSICGPYALAHDPKRFAQLFD